MAMQAEELGEAAALHFQSVTLLATVEQTLSRPRTFTAALATRKYVLGGQPLDHATGDSGTLKKNLIGIISFRQTVIDFVGGQIGQRWTRLHSLLAGSR